MKAAAKFGFVVEYVADIDAAARFYIEVLGLEVRRRHPSFVQFDTFAIASDAPMRAGEPLELYWLVDDAQAACAEIGAKTPIVLPPTQLPFGTVFGVRDPEGQARYLLQLAQQRPSVAVA